MKRTHALAVWRSNKTINISSAAGNIADAPLLENVTERFAVRGFDIVGKVPHNVIYHQVTCAVVHRFHALAVRCTNEIANIGLYLRDGAMTFFLRKAVDSSPIIVLCIYG